MTILERLRQQVRESPEAHASYLEARMRESVGAAIDAEATSQGLSLRALATRMKTSLSQVRRVLNREGGGSLSLLTVARAAVALDLEIQLRLQPKRARRGVLCRPGFWRSMTLPRGLQRSDDTPSQRSRTG